MAAKKPLCLYSGQIQQIQSGDTLDAEVSGKETVSLTNGNASTINICEAVYMKATDDTCDLAQADAAGTSEVLGLVADTTIAASASGNIQTNGVVTATTGQWDAVAGTTGGLTAGTKYFLSAAAAGDITETPPTSGYITYIGVALSATELLLEPERAIKL